MIRILVSKAPEEPNRKETWAKQMARIQYAILVDEGARCEMCGHIYESVDDFIARNPRAASVDPLKFACDKCWLAEQEQ